jgi:hypothetical protein
LRLDIDYDISAHKQIESILNFNKVPIFSLDYNQMDRDIALRKILMLDYQKDAKVN